MRKLFNKLPKKILALGAIFATSVVLSAAAMATFGPDRTTREWTAAETGFDYVTFNSFTGVPNGIGDERDFLRGVVSGRDAQWQDPVNSVANNDTVTAKIYIHNNADSRLNTEPGEPGIARDVNVKIEIPTGLDDDQEVTSTVSASNAVPQAIFDTLDINSVNDSLFQLAYVPGSATLTNTGETLSDNIFTTGIAIGDQLGCFDYVQEITFEMKIEKPGYQIQKVARLKGEDNSKWRKVVNAKSGDTIEWEISFQNTGSTTLDNVSVVDDLPSYTDVNEDLIELYNANNPDGFTFPSSAVQDNGDQVNVLIGDYTAGSNAFIYLETVIESNAEIACGNHQIANVAYVTPEGLGTLNDNAKVNIINGDCVEVVYECVSLTAPRLTLNNGESTKFTAAARSSEDADDNDDEEISEYEFSVNGEVVQTSDSNMYTYNASDAGTYKVTVRITFNNGEVVSSAERCAEEVTVSEEPDAPVYACEMFSLVLSGRKATVMFLPVAKNGATFKDATIVFKADGLSKQEVTTNSQNTDGKVVAVYTYDDQANSLVATATVRFNVGDEVKDVTCRDNAVLAAVTTPTVLPNTGAGSIAGLFAAVTVAGAVAHRTFALKRQ